MGCHLRPASCPVMADYDSSGRPVYLFEGDILLGRSIASADSPDDVYVRDGVTLEVTDI
jgi:hypothetical protein